MTARPFIVQAQLYPPALDVLGARITVLAPNSATRSPPPHCHPWDETFFVTRGRVTFEYDGQTTQTRKGVAVAATA
jgi:quercetin dioxygenase-like cupin family protein